MKKSVKVLALSLALCLGASALAGCGGKKSETAVDIKGMEALTENKMPITTEDITFKLWMRNQSQGYAEDYENYKVVKELEKITGIKMDFIHPVGAAEEQLNIMLASGDLPDIIHYYVGGGIAEKNIEDGAYIDLTDYVDKFAPNFKKLIEESEAFREGIESLGGKISYLPGYTDDEAYGAYNGYFVRGDWLKEAGLSIPETIEDWEKMLIAFRDGKFGSGKVVPFATITSGSMNNEIFASAFGLGNIISTYRIDDKGVVSHNILQPGYKEYLKTMNKWYKDGLIDPNVFATTVKQIDSMMLNNELGSVYIDNNNDIPKYMTADPSLELTAVPYPASKDGKRVSPTAKSTISNLGFVVTTDCKYPVEAVRLLDYLYSSEGSDLVNWGIEGETYTKDADGNKAFTDYVLANPDGKTPQEAFASTYFARSATPGIVQYSAMRGLEAKFSDDIKTQRENSIQYSLAADKSSNLSFPSLTKDESDSLAGKKNEVNTYITEMHQKYILGKESLDSFDEFIETAKKIGLTEVIEIYQKAYDRVSK